MITNMEQSFLSCEWLKKLENVSLEFPFDGHLFFRMPLIVISNTEKVPCWNGLNQWINVPEKDSLP
uniref:Uncharacterized protein n=1 Tax=Rhizophora mucronata TaxID=61149 RepID=A0A2P2QN37_RHIMU